MLSDRFRTLVTRHITDLILLFIRLNSIFKQLLSRRLRQLRIANDGGSQHGLLASDLFYYIKQVQSFSGLEMLESHVDEVFGPPINISSTFSFLLLCIYCFFKLINIRTSNQYA